MDSYYSDNPTLTFIYIVVLVIVTISQWKIFKKAGYEGWEAVIPIYNLVILFKVAGLSPWSIILLIVPFINIYILFKLYIELAHKFGKSTGFGVATVFASVICLPMLAFDENCTYLGTNNMYNQNNNFQQMYNQQPMNNQNNGFQQMYNQQPMYNQNNGFQQMYNQQPMNNQSNNFCTNCGQQLNSNDSFCTRCGKQR